MHFTTTDRVVKAAVSRLRALNPDDRGLPLAWVLGSVAHMTMDATLHPCIHSSVGPYAQNKREHRVCEMNQDFHAFQRLSLGTADLPDRPTPVNGQASWRENVC